VEANVDFQSVIDRFFSAEELLAWVTPEIGKLQAEKKTKLLKLEVDQQLLSMDWHSAIHNRNRLKREYLGEGSSGWDFSSMKKVVDFREVKKKEDQLLKELDAARQEVRDARLRLDKIKSERAMFLAECNSREIELKKLFSDGPAAIWSRSAEVVAKMEARRNDMEARRRKKLGVEAVSEEEAALSAELNKGAGR
jgi:hypothetical protein